MSHEHQRIPHIPLLRRELTRARVETIFEDRQLQHALDLRHQDVGGQGTLADSGCGEMEEDIGKGI